MALGKSLRAIRKALAPIKKKHQTKNVKKLMTSDKAYKKTFKKGGKA